VPRLRESSKVRDFLNSDPLWLGTVAFLAAFVTYFSMYAFRRPFVAGTYGGEASEFLQFHGEGITFKSAFILSQVLGYAVSKYLGAKFCSETHRHQVAPRLVILILAAWLALVFFGFLPGRWKALALFFNGLPIGMVWGLLVRVLEGRRLSEAMFAGLAASYVLAGGWLRAAGRWILDTGLVNEFWMPLALATCFLPWFLAGAWVLHQLPPPGREDEMERAARPAMDRHRRKDFIREFFPGVMLLALMFFLLTAYRDFRDNFQVDLFVEMGMETEPVLLLMTETPVALVVTLSLVFLSMVRDNRRALITGYSLMAVGSAMLGISTALFQNGMIGGGMWMMLSGMGAYLAYVPLGSAVIERTIAYTRFVGTAAFAISLVDAVGYTGSVGVILWKDFFAADLSRLGFITGFSWLMCLSGLLLSFASLWYFLRKGSEAQMHP